jgi:hypothetical protein
MNRKGPRDHVFEAPSLFVDMAKVEKLCADAVEGKSRQFSANASPTVLRAIIHLAAIGWSDLAISKRLGLTKNWVEAITKGKSVAAEIERIQVENYRRDYKEMFEQLVPQAVQNIFDLMVKKSYKESVRLEAAKYIVDRALGKPKETIETKNDMISQVFQLLGKQNPDASQNQPIDAQFESIENKSTPKDSLEELFGSTDTGPKGETT